MSSGEGREGSRQHLVMIRRKDPGPSAGKTELRKDGGRGKGGGGRGVGRRRQT